MKAVEAYGSRAAGHLLEVHKHKGGRSVLGKMISNTSRALTQQIRDKYLHNYKSVRMFLYKLQLSTSVLGEYRPLADGERIRLVLQEAVVNRSLLCALDILCIACDTPGVLTNAIKV